MFISKSVLFTLLGVVGIIGFMLSIIWTRPGQISQTAINQMCQNFYNDLQSQIATIENYRIDKSTKSCNPIQDEMGATDYSLSIHFKVLRSQGSTAKVDKNELDQFSRKLPVKNYQVLIGNMQNGELAMCISAGRYIDNDGKDYPQEGIPNGPKAQYVEAGSTRGSMPCEDM